MEKYLKYGVIALVAVTVLIAIFKISSCFSPEPVTIAGNTVTPVDSGFNPITTNTYIPPSFPFSEKKIPVKLPWDVNETDVKKVITVDLIDTTSGDIPQRIQIIETNEDEIFVQKDGRIEKVEVLTVKPPFFRFSLDAGLGLSAAWESPIVKCSPIVVFAPLRWAGWLDAPVLAADLFGVGAGAQGRLYHDIFIGAGAFYGYGGDRRVEAFLTYNF